MQEYNSPVSDKARTPILRRMIRLMLTLFIFITASQIFAHAVVYEKYLLVFPLRPTNTAAVESAWFGKAFRFVIEETVLSLKTLVFIKDDEVRSIQKEYKLDNQEPEPGLMERIADDKDVAVLYGTYQLNGDKVVLVLNLIPGRNFDARTFKITSTINRLDKLFTNVFLKTTEVLELSTNESDQQVFTAAPGTRYWSALRSYFKAQEILKPNPRNEKRCLKAIPFLTQALKKDGLFLPARTIRALSRITLVKTSKSKNKQLITLAKNDIDKAVKLNSDHPLVMNVQAAYLMLFKKYTEAKKIAEKNLELYPANYTNYLLLGKIYRALKLNDESEKVLLAGLDQQGTALQKKPFHRDLGLLLLKKKDKHAEVYLKEVLMLEPKNVRLYYLRATALFRLKKYIDVMHEIQKAEVIKTWRDLQLLKAETALALGNVFYEEGDYDRGYSYASIAVNIREKHFETLLLMAKVLRKKGFRLEARKQLEEAQNLARKNNPKDHLWLGTEFVAQGMKNRGAQEYVLYLKLNPKAPERRRLILLIRKLQGDTDE